PHRGSEQPHQGHQAHGLWISRLGLLLPENQGRVPRESAMNHKKPRRSGVKGKDGRDRQASISSPFCLAFCASSAAACRAVRAMVKTMSSTSAPRDRSFTGLARPCSIGPTLITEALRCTALEVVLPVFRSGNMATVAWPATGLFGVLDLSPLSTEA